VLWYVVGYRFYTHSRDISPAGMANSIEQDFIGKEKEAQQLLKNTALIEKIFANTLNEDEVAKLRELPYYLYAYNDDFLQFWNNNKLLTECRNYSNSEQLLYNEKGVFVTRCIEVNSKKKEKLTIVFPIVFLYPFENKHLTSQFSAGSYIPVSTRIHSNPVKGGFGIKNISGKEIFYLKFNSADQPPWIPDVIMIVLLMTAVTCSISWLQLVGINISRKYSAFLGLIFTIAIIVGVRVLSYKFDLPFNLNQLPIFSSMLYATSALHKSLGDLLLNALSFLWIIAYLLGNLSLENIDSSKLSRITRVVLSALVSVCIVVFAFTFINIINSLVVDSKIPFDVSNFYSINKYTIYGLITVCIIAIACYLLIYLLSTLYNRLNPKKWQKYISTAIIGVIIILCSDTTRTGYYSYILLAWLLLFIILLDVKWLKYTDDLLAPNMIFWAFFLCLFCTALLQYFNAIKEQDIRKTFADEIVQQRDLFIEEVTFGPLSQSIQNDKALHEFLSNPSKDSRRRLNERFETLYLGGQLNKYDVKLLVFDADGRSVYNNDTLSYATLWKQTEKAVPTSDSNLYYKEYAQDGHYYLARIPLYNQSNRIGVVFIDMAVKESSGETVYPELLQPATKNIYQTGESYSYAIYANHKLLTQTNDYAFPIYINQQLKKQYTTIVKEDIEELWYKASKSKTVIVVHKQKRWLENITLFSYLFGIQVMIAILIISYKSTVSYIAKPRRTGKLVNFTLRRRIHFSMLGIVLVSFFIIGMVTIVYFTVQYGDNTRNKLLGTMQVAERIVVQYLDKHDGITNSKDFNKVSTSDSFKYFITDLSNTQKVDINVYATSGLLNVTSQDNIYDRSLLARIMRQDAFYELSVQKSSQLMQNESIGKLNYLSCYVPIRNEAGNTVGYINIPYYSSQKELSYQISNIVVALINLYAFIFLLSGLLTVIITRWITRSFNVVIERFGKLNLSKNELIDWPYDDEIGVLVDEYNKMVKKVEENAMLMAQTERETAWREMAQQVAHEIKNPLTPMKLNIQYLQQALRNKQDNIAELTGKVSESLIEQIDNLSYIASEFSNFAKMPEARPEHIDVNNLITAASELFLNDNAVKVIIEKNEQPVLVLADKSQMQRVFTNLLQNGVQSIPEQSQGKITLSVKKENGFALISFADNGTGISNDAIEKIFQPYFTTKTSGTGLGLAMTKRIIEFWAGEIWFETKEGEGTTFYIKLPLAHEA
jgi:signal transduction histidine kinase